VRIRVGGTVVVAAAVAVVVIVPIVVGPSVLPCHSCSTR